MALERYQPNQSDLTQVLEKIKQESLNSPDRSPFVFLAKHFGNEGREKLREIDRKLTERIGYLPEDTLHPGSELYQLLSHNDIESEREDFIVGYGAVWFDSVLETYFEAKKDDIFDFNFMAAIYNERTRGTCVIKFPDINYPMIRLPRPEFRRLFDRDESGGVFFSDQGLPINLDLKKALIDHDALPIIRSRTLRSWNAFAEALKKPPTTLQIAQIDEDMPIRGSERNLPPDKEKQYLDRLKLLLG